jgi:hypothetical protein
MIHALIVSLVIALVFYLLWKDEREKNEEAQMQIRKLQRQINQLKKPKQPPKKTGPVTVEKQTATREYVIRKPEPVKPLLDQKKLAELQQQTKEAQSMLAEIFVQEEETVKVPEARPGRQPYLDVLERLFSKEVWTREEIAQMVGPDVMIGNLLEQINDYACSRIDDIVLEEDGDRIYVTVEYKDRLI